MKKNINQNKGFTIIEMMVAVSIFMIVVTLGIGALMNANFIHKKSSDSRSVMDNLSFIMEEMSKNLRTGYTYRCFVDSDLIPNYDSEEMTSPGNCLSGGKVIAFESSLHGKPPEINDKHGDDQWLYKFEANSVLKSTNGGPNFVQLNSDQISLDSTSGFIVSGAESSDTLQPFVIIKLSGKFTLNNISTPFALQTSVSQRSIDLGP